MKALYLALALLALTSAAQASHVAAPCAESGTVMNPSCMGGPSVATSTKHRQPVVAEVTSGRPIGCPEKFCGCGSSIHLFGKIIPSLNAAINWLQFPRAAPAPLMAAVKRHHVMVLEADLGGGVWKVFDPNSGHHMTHVHARSIAGFIIVNPHV
jgi:hypothetical protein